MTEDLQVYEACQALAKPSGKNYRVTSPLTGNEVTLVRDVDFAKIPKTKIPSITKSGAEKICMAYGLMQRYSIESKIEEVGKENLFYYLVKCELVKLGSNNQEYVFSSAFGSANTNEKRNGFNGAFDAANSTLKMAQKRALTAAALAISGLSSMFTQDMENDNYMEKSNDLIEENPDAAISTAQARRIYAIFADNGFNTAQAKNKLATMGITSTKQIKQSEYDALVEKILKEITGE